MYFIAILIMLVLVQFWPTWQVVQKDDLYYRWQSMVMQQTENKLYAFLASVIFPCFLLILFHAVARTTGNWALLMIDFLLAVVILFYSLGRGIYNANSSAYCLAWEKGEYTKLPEIVQKVDADYVVQKNESPQQTHVAAREGFIYAGFTRMFVVIFWFSLLGPVAALLYRLTDLFNKTQDVDVARNVTLILEWPAGRLLSITFALMGDFASGMTSLASTLFNFGMTTKQVVHANALAALNMDMSWLAGKFSDMHSLEEQATLAPMEIREIKDLMKRCLVFALIVIAIFQIIAP